jgi:hypothetical protein
VGPDAPPSAPLPLRLRRGAHQPGAARPPPRPLGFAPPAREKAVPPSSGADVARVVSGTARRLAAAAVAPRRTKTPSPGTSPCWRPSPPRRSAPAPRRVHAGQRWRRLDDRVELRDSEPDPEASPSVPRHEGMSLHADVAVPARDRRRLERLCRYVARPPLAHDRLEARPDGRVALRLKTRWRDSPRPCGRPR